ncbi:hypothetical protein LCGC14_1803720, partial [marine sediment metagenome]
MTIRKIYTVLFVSLLSGFFINILAQEDTNSTPLMVTDRPDETESSKVVPKGLLQVETGSLYETFDDNDITSERLVYNTTLLRYGLLENLELRLGWNFEEQRTKIAGIQREDVLSGLSPLLLGLKINITDEKNGLPEIGLVGHLFLPFAASDDYKLETTGADFRLAFSHTLSEKSSLGYNIGAEWGNDDPSMAYIYSISYGYSITDRLGFFAEIYGDLPENAQANHFWDTGFTYLLRPRIQIDLLGGSSITAGQDFFLSAGIS